MDKFLGIVHLYLLYFCVPVIHSVTFKLQTQILSCIYHGCLLFVVTSSTAVQYGPPFPYCIHDASITPERYLSCLKSVCHAPCPINTANHFPASPTASKATSTPLVKRQIRTHSTHATNTLLSSQVPSPSGVVNGRRDFTATCMARSA
ncbi:hypothetical protein BDN67DRAFT_324803 [Paxillus ammoniavirescens]|nr:hypothetical protein BDN67DRAFT_324803 [Paxillus ammoniavirescens]